jgi:hypothetical protein
MFSFIISEGLECNMRSNRVIMTVALFQSLNSSFTGKISYCRDGCASSPAKDFVAPKRMVDLYLSHFLSRCQKKF